ncbi:MAG: PQQ-binding-like beta-propeller repeat protein [Candidatus Sumerlaeota bacterium]|nr:PQQ-binding-like beta-propeller repeat protein [Candidatus Sumerlaeota bacterium]
MDNVDADFFVRLNMVTDCADVPYLIRWIFARIYLLPQGAHDRFGNIFGSWCTDFAGEPRNPDWRKDSRFFRALERVAEMVQCRAYPFDTYPIQILPDAGFLRPGTVVNDENHSRIITEIDRKSFFPIIYSASTLPPAVRRLTVEMLNRDCEFDASDGYGIVNWNWYRRDPATREWAPVPDPQMPGYSLEQFDMINKIQEEHLCLYLQDVYGYKVNDPNQALQEMTADLFSAIQTRIEVVDKAQAFYGGHSGMTGDTHSDAYDFFSTNQRDARIRNKYLNLDQFVQRRYFAEDDLNDFLGQNKFVLTSGMEVTLLELGYAVRHHLMSAEPWDSIPKRWGQGGWRLDWHRPAGGDVDSGILPGPNGGIVATVGGSALRAFSPDGKRLWEVRSPAPRSSVPAFDGSVYYALDDGGTLEAIDAKGKSLWRARAEGSEFCTPALGGADGLIYTASNRGAVQAFHRADGKAAWSLDVEPRLRGPACGGDGPLVVNAENGDVHGVSRDGKLLWSKKVGGRVYTPPAADAAGNAYVFCENGNVYSFSPAGELRWTYDTGARLVFRATVGPNNAIYVAAGNSVVCLDPSGHCRWQAAATNEIYAPPCVTVDGSAYVGSIDKTLYAISPSGQTRWTFPAPSTILSSPYAAPDGRVYVGPTDKRIYALHARGK